MFRTVIQNKCNLRYLRKCNNPQIGTRSYCAKKGSNLHPAFQDVVGNLAEEDFSAEYNGKPLARLVKINTNRQGVDMDMDSIFFKNGNVPKVKFVKPDENKS